MDQNRLEKEVLVEARKAYDAAFNHLLEGMKPFIAKTLVESMHTPRNDWKFRKMFKSAINPAIADLYHNEVKRIAIAEYKRLSELKEST